MKTLQMISYSTWKQLKALALNVKNKQGSCCCLFGPYDNENFRLLG